MSRLLLPLLLLVAPALFANLVSEPVAYEHAGVKLEGYLVFDDTKVSKEKPAPGVLIVHEWWGHNDYVRSRAEQVAKLGYVAFALDMYGKGVLTTDPKKAGELASQFYGKPLMAERARAGLDVLLSRPEVDKKRVASIGYCFGGAVSQALAQSGAPLAGIVSFHGSLIPFTAESAKLNRARVLVCNGAADTFVSEGDISAFLRSVNENAIDCQFINYSSAVHAFTNPGADELARITGIKGIGYNANADRRSWEAMKLFFGEVF
ncbi:dienelactone hydrolase family protein [Nibricoccus sp. IMCC34717]|uniref:dienelactone hydrolase family protein n=1 Tax=Nibricoccus sp. IMCC34717 TaxID=3034021 RepID=UPI00384B0766